MTIKDAIDELRSVNVIKDDWLNSTETNEALDTLLDKISNGYTLVNVESIRNQLKQHITEGNSDYELGVNFGIFKCFQLLHKAEEE